MTTYILTLDVGTSSTRAILFDEQARPVPDCLAQTPNQLETAGDGTAIFDAEHLLHNVVETIDQVLQLSGDRAEAIGAVTMATLVSNVLGTDRAGQPLTPVYTYADTRNAPDAAALREELRAQGRVAAHDRTGCLIHTSYLPARFRWLQRDEPELLERVDHWLSIGEYLLWQFLGERAVSYSVASWTGLLNRRELTWDAEWLEQLPVSDTHLSPLIDVDEPMRGLDGEWALRWPALRNVPWFPAIGDGAAANLGSGCGALQQRDAARVALTIGTTGAMRMVVDAERAAEVAVPDGLWLYRIDAKRALLGGATTEGGNLYAWLRKTLQLPETDEIEEQLRQRPPATHGLTMLPFIAGERAPGWDDDARASLLGFTLHTTPLDILQSGLEGVAYRFAQIYQRIVSSLAPTMETQIIASGGALLSSPAWLQIMADVLNQPVVSLEEQEITARGLALLALQQLGLVRDSTALEPALGRTYQPDAERHAAHLDALQQQVDFYKRLH